ncbi:hypothetical protein RRG08_007991, partial [Elysia crispata]
TAKRSKANLTVKGCESVIMRLISDKNKKKQQNPQNDHHTIGIEQQQRLF